MREAFGFESLGSLTGGLQGSDAVQGVEYWVRSSGVDGGVTLKHKKPLTH